MDRLLKQLERVFGVALTVLVALMLLGQAVLSTPEGRRLLSRAERLEGVKLKVIAPDQLEVSGESGVEEHRELNPDNPGRTGEGP